METTAQITIYLQALGGKFLGPNAYNTDAVELSIKLEQGMPLLIGYRLSDTVNDGTISSDFNGDTTPTQGLSSFLPILTPSLVAGDNPAVNYLTPDENTICGTTALSLSQPAALGTISAGIPRPNAEDLVLTQSIALNQSQTDYRVIMIVPGLLLEQPETFPPSGAPPTIFVYVKMMCGCPVKSGTEPNTYWVQSDFDVSAEVIHKDGSTDTKTLTFINDSTPSLFHAPVKDLSNIARVNFTAKQKSTGNIGYLSVDYPG
jgi:hypothetical protein